MRLAIRHVCWRAVVNQRHTVFYVRTRICPTNLRASVVGAMSLVAFGGSLLGGIVFVFLQNFIDLGWLCLGFTVPFMAAALILISKRIGETKEIDLKPLPAVNGIEREKSMYMSMKKEWRQYG